MQSLTYLLTLLAATGAMALPQDSAARQERQQANSNVLVTLTDAAGTPLRVALPDPGRHGPVQRHVGSHAVQKKVLLTLGNGVDPTLRCAIFDAATGRPLTIQRGANIDTTFADGGAGEWTILQPAVVSGVVCDPAFRANPVAPPPPPPADDKKKEIRVVVSNQLVEFGAQLTFTEGVRDAKPVSSRDGIQTVELRLGADVDPAYRCQVQDPHGRVIPVSRGANLNQATFGDGGKGAWTLPNGQREGTVVGRIICDPTF